MRPPGQVLATVGIAVVAMLSAGLAQAQKQGGALRVYHRDSAASMSILEEVTISTVVPVMGVFNNLVMFDQHVPQNSLDSIVPDLAVSWAWSDNAKELTFKLRDGVRWHDGKPFTAADVQCTWDLILGKSPTRLRIDPRKSWYWNLDHVAAKGADEVVFRLKQPQPAFIALLASGFSPVYPCHVPPADMRQHPIGTGPFKFVEYKPNQGIKVTRNPDYWKPGRPYLDGIDYTIIPNRSTALLAFESGKFDLTWPYDVAIPLVREVKAQAPQAICEVAPLNASRNLDINPAVPPFDNPDLRRAMALSLDSKAFIDILTEGQGDIGGVMQPPPARPGGLPPAL